MHTVDKGLLASRQVERGCLGGFTRLRTPLGLVMRRLSADCDRETGCIPQCHLVLGGYVGSDRRVLIAYHDIYLLSLCFPLSIRSSFSPLRVHVSIHLPNSSCCSYLLLDAAHLLYPLSLFLSLSRLPSTGYFGSHVGGLSNETYKEHVVESGTGLKVVGSLW